MKDNDYLRQKIQEEEDYYWENFYSPKAILKQIVFGILTLGTYNLKKSIDNKRRIGLI